MPTNPIISEHRPRRRWLAPAVAFCVGVWAMYAATYAHAATFTQSDSSGSVNTIAMSASTWVINGGSPLDSDTTPIQTIELKVQHQSSCSAYYEIILNDGTHTPTSTDNFQIGSGSIGTYTFHFSQADVTLANVTGIQLREVGGASTCGSMTWRTSAGDAVATWKTFVDPGFGASSTKDPYIVIVSGPAYDLDAPVTTIFYPEDGDTVTPGAAPPIVTAYTDVPVDDEPGASGEMAFGIYKDATLVWYGTSPLEECTDIANCGSGGLGMWYAASPVVTLGYVLGDYDFIAYATFDGHDAGGSDTNTITVSDAPPDLGGPDSDPSCSIIGDPEFGFSGASWTFGADDGFKCLWARLLGVVLPSDASVTYLQESFGGTSPFSEFTEVVAGSTPVCPLPSLDLDSYAVFEAAGDAGITMPVYDFCDEAEQIGDAAASGGLQLALKAGVSIAILIVGIRLFRLFVAG